MADDDKLGLTKDEKILQEAQDRFKLCAEWESESRKRWLDDVKFAEADADNQWQWPNKLATDRIQDNQPVLTVNKTRQHILQITNDMKQNKPTIKARAVSDATYEAAQVWEGIFRHIEYQSRAQQAYDTAGEFQVKGGIGYWRVVTAYVDDEVFDQEIYIKRVQNPLTVYLDPNIKEFDGSDAQFGFVYDDVPRKEFERDYPEFKDIAGEQNSVTQSAPSVEWANKDYVRVAEYYRIVKKPDELLAFQHDGQLVTVRKSELPRELYKKLDEPGTAKRKTTTAELQWFKIVGNKIVDRVVPCAGKYIPIVRLIGEETIIEKKLDRKGHTRAMKDPQRIYNYWTSSAVEHVALQGKTPWIAPAESIEGFETYWEAANRVNYAVLPYNAYDDNGQLMQHKPERPQPPQMAQAYIQGMQISGQELMAVSGQYQAQLGQQGNERSKAAIQERNREGDNATYHFIDHMGVAIEYTGRILLDLVPRVYDTERVLRILNEDGTDQEIKIDPGAQQALNAKRDEVTKKIVSDIVLNPRKGKFSVYADIGPAFATKRQAAFDAFTTLLTQAPDLTKVIGDIMLRAADFPNAAEAAERLKRLVPPEALGVGPTEREKVLQMQLENLTGLLSKALEDLGKEKRKSESKDQLRLTDAFDAETRRLSALKDYLVTQPDMIQRVVKDTLKDALGVDLESVVQATKPGLAEEARGEAPPAAMQQQTPPHPDAQRGADGNWYMPDPMRQGHLVKVDFHGR